MTQHKLSTCQAVLEDCRSSLPAVAKFSRDPRFHTSPIAALHAGPSPVGFVSNLSHVRQRQGTPEGQLDNKDPAAAPTASACCCCDPSPCAKCMSPPRVGCGMCCVSCDYGNLQSLGSHKLQVLQQLAQHAKPAQSMCPQISRRPGSRMQKAESSNRQWRHTTPL